MATRLHTSFPLPRDHEDGADHSNLKYWVDVQDDYEKVFNQSVPVAARHQHVGGRFSCHTSQIIGFEELVPE